MRSIFSISSESVGFHESDHWRFAQWFGVWWYWGPSRGDRSQSLERTRKEIFVSAVMVALWHHTDVMTETLSSRVTTGCAWGTGTMEHAPWCPLSPVHNLTSHIPHAFTLPTLLRTISWAPHSTLMLEGRGTHCRWINRSLKQIISTLRRHRC